MASIVISNIAPLGSSFFSESENYLEEMQQAELASTHGGGTPGALVVFALAGAGSFLYAFLYCLSHP